MFPLRDGFFKPLQFAPEDLASWKELVVGLVDRTLAEEAPVVATQYEGGVDTRQWKHVKTRDQLRVFQPRSGSVAAINAPCVLAVGTIEGTLEDVIYGIHNTTTRDIRVTRAFLSDSSLDSAVLHVFENGSDDDPFRSLALKWRVVATPAGNLVKNRDGCMLEYMGISRDEHGRRFAFQVSENLDHPICPRFTDQGVVRAEVHIRAIYRELDAGRVGVYFHGGYNMSGHIPKFLASWTAAAVAFSVGKSVECAEAKKLTALALSKTHVAMRQQRHRQNRLSSVQECAICKTNPSILSSSHECDVCSSVVCSKCSSHKHVLSETTKIRVNCCKQCLVAAKSVIVDPRKPLKLVSSGLWVSRGVLSATSAKSVEPELKIPRCNETMSARQRSLDPSEDVETQIKDLQHPKYGRMSAFETREPAPTAAVRRHSDENTEQVHPEMWMQMLELRKAAEQTYRLTKEVNKLMAPEPLTRAYTR